MSQQAELKPTGPVTSRRQPATPKIIRKVVIRGREDSQQAHLLVPGIHADDLNHEISLDKGRIDTETAAKVFRERLGIELLDWEARRLAAGLNLMRITIQWRDTRLLLVPDNARKTKVAKDIKTAIRKLLQTLPGFIDTERAGIARGGLPKPLAEYLLTDGVGDFENLLRVAERLRQFAEPDVKAAEWHPDALWIACFARMVMNRVGNEPVDFTKAESPGVLLIHDALDLARIPQTVDAIEGAFRRRKSPNEVPSMACIGLGQ